VAQEATDDLAFSINLAGGKVEIGNLPTIEADAVQIRHLLQNLIENSLKYTARTTKAP
jgi:signal transduction histidine kinase